MVEAEAEALVISVECQASQASNANLTQMASSRVEFLRFALCMQNLPFSRTVQDQLMHHNRLYSRAPDVLLVLDAINLFLNAMRQKPAPNDAARSTWVPRDNQSWFNVGM